MEIWLCFIFKSTFPVAIQATAADTVHDYSSSGPKIIKLKLETISANQMLEI
jgi:hypothetical protein